MSRKLLCAVSAFVVALTLPASVGAQSVHLIPWTGLPGELEATIKADTLADGSQAHDIYELEKGRVYLQVEGIDIVNSGFTLRGQAFDANNPADIPATVQPLPGPDGVSRFNPNWSANFWILSSGASLRLENINFNGAYADQSAVLAGVVVAFNTNQTVEMENSYVSMYSVIALTTWQNGGTTRVNNSVFYANPAFPGGMFFNGVIGGGGSWMGTFNAMSLTNSTVANYFGNTVLAYESFGATAADGVIDHVSFVNNVLPPLYCGGSNNVTVSNSLFYNTSIYPQELTDLGQTLWRGRDKGVGIMDICMQADPTGGSREGKYDHLNRHIVFHNNAWVVDEQVQTYWQSVDAPLPLSQTNLWVSDSSRAVMDLDATIQEHDNVHTTATLKLESEYLTRMIHRTEDYRDNQAFDYPDYATYFWQYEHDGDATTTEWPMHEDLRYSVGSPAATASTTGGPVGDPRWIPYLNVGSETEELPSQVALDQNYPNPFNPSTEIAFTLSQAGSVTLTVYNLLGQKVRTLVDANLSGGAHRYTWNGRDDSGQGVSSGVYLYTLNAGGRSMTKKMSLIK